MGGDDHDSLDPDDRGARLRAAGPASADPAVSNVASEPSHGSSAFPGAVASATAVARIHGISPTVAALKINYYDRQRRLHSGQACRRGRPPAAVFVEVPWPCSRPAHPHPRGQSNSGRTCRCASVATYSFGVSSQAKIRGIPVA